MSTEARIEDPAAFDDSPEGQARRWSVELTAAKKWFAPWHKRGDEILKRFLDDRDGGRWDGDTRWNLYTSNVQMQEAILYGNTPKSTVSRRHADSSDDIGRVAGEALERLLNTDIERDSDTYALALEYALKDRLKPGLACARARYVATFETKTTQAVLDEGTGQVLAESFTQEVKTHEDVEIDYVHWQDVLWNECRVWHEKRWIAFRAPMSRKELCARFPATPDMEAAGIPGHGSQVPLNAKRHNEDRKAEDPWDRADVWEIWDKETKNVYWYVEGYPVVLDVKPDTLGLDGFFPCPRPMFANLTTSKLLPTPDFAISQDLYDEIDRVSTRITRLERFVRVVGAYNKGAPELAGILDDLNDGEMLPVDNWAAYSERGGIKGNIDFLPIEAFVNAIMALRQVRMELVDAVYQVTGLSDVMRGQQVSNGTPGEAGIKAKFGSARMQFLQDDFARFASELLRIKAEIIVKHFDDKTIIERANMAFTQDAPKAVAAVQMLKSRFWQYRVEVKPEAVSLTDFAALKAERTEVIGAIAQYMSAVAPIAQQMPQSQPYLLQMLQWMVAGLRGAGMIEGVLDQAVTAAQQAEKQRQMQPANDNRPLPDPRLMAAQLKAQADLAKVTAERDADLVRIQAETAAADARERSQFEWNTKERVMNAQLSPKPFGVIR